MLVTFAQWLAGVGWIAFTWALAALILLNVGAFVLFSARGNRDHVARNTSWWLAANLLLIAIGVGVPAITAVARLALVAARVVLPDVGAAGD